jgi:hypothetical protein
MNTFFLGPPGIVTTQVCNMFSETVKSEAQARVCLYYTPVLEPEWI